jgi:hypothetical protein
MGKLNNILRNVETGYAHWCPGCLEMHVLPNSWNFNGNIDKPTFTPSFKHGGIKRVFQDGKWTGEWELDVHGNSIPYVCHYILTDGILNFCGDCTHGLSGKSVPIPPLP